MGKITHNEMREINMLSNQIIGACIEVHKILGPGLLESAYEECLCHELFLRNISFARQMIVPIEFKGLKLNNGFRLDILVENKVVIELKAVEDLEPIHSAQLYTYLKLTGLHLGLLANFNVALMKDGIRRVINDIPDADPIDDLIAQENRRRMEARQQ